MLFSCWGSCSCGHLQVEIIIEWLYNFQGCSRRDKCRTQRARFREYLNKLTRPVTLLPTTLRTHQEDLVWVLMHCSEYCRAESHGGRLRQTLTPYLKNVYSHWLDGSYLTGWAKYTTSSSSSRLDCSHNFSNSLYQERAAQKHPTRYY